MFTIKLTEKSSLSKIADSIRKTRNEINLLHDFVYYMRGDE